MTLKWRYYYTYTSSYKEMSFFLLNQVTYVHKIKFLFGYGMRELLFSDKICIKIFNHLVIFIFILSIHNILQNCKLEPIRKLHVKNHSFSSKSALLMFNAFAYLYSTTFSSFLAKALTLQRKNDFRGSNSLLED